MCYQTVSVYTWGASEVTRSCCNGQNWLPNHVMFCMLTLPAILAPILHAQLGEKGALICTESLASRMAFQTARVVSERHCQGILEPDLIFVAPTMGL